MKKRSEKDILEDALNLNVIKNSVDHAEVKASLKRRFKNAVITFIFLDEKDKAGFPRAEVFDCTENQKTRGVYEPQRTRHIIVLWHNDVDRIISYTHTVTTVRS